MKVIILQIMIGIFLISGCSSDFEWSSRNDVLESIDGVESQEFELGSEWAGEIRIGSASTIYPVLEYVSNEFRKINPQVKFEILNQGSMMAIQELKENKLHIIASSIRLKKEDYIELENAKLPVKEVLMGYDGIVVIVHPDNDWIQYISQQNVRKIFEAGSSIQQWSDVKSEWPNKTIHKYIPSKKHGTQDFFSRKILDGSTRYDEKSKPLDQMEDIIEKVESDKDAIAFVSYPFYIMNTEYVKALEVSNGINYIMPSDESILQGDYYPLSRELYLYVNVDEMEKIHYRSFLRYFIHNMKEAVRFSGLMALENEEYEEQLSFFED
jgi:phosphate transport system substrate-binding protein